MLEDSSVGAVAHPVFEPLAVTPAQHQLPALEHPGVGVGLALGLCLFLAWMARDIFRRNRRMRRNRARLALMQETRAHESRRRIAA